MSIDVRVVSSETEGGIREWHTVNSQFEPEHTVLMSATERQQHGVWKVANRTTAGTTIITAPFASGALLVTDLILSTDKVAGSSVQLQFTDGANTEVIALFDSANAPVSLSISINGRLHGWKDARLEMVTVNAVDASIMVGYMKIKSVQDFNEWDSER